MTPPSPPAADEGRRLVDPDWCEICGDTPKVEGTELCDACLGVEFEDDEEEED